MKTIRNLAFILALLMSPMAFTSCATTGNVLASTALTVDASMKAWATYVVQGNATDAEQMTVRNAYAKYQLAMDGAVKAYAAADAAKDKSLADQAIAILKASQSDLQDIVAGFLKPKSNT